MKSAQPLELENYNYVNYKLFARCLLRYNMDERSVCQLMAAECDLEYRKQHIMTAVRRAEEAREYAQRCKFSVEYRSLTERLDMLRQQPHYQRQMIKNVGYCAMKHVLSSGAEDTTEKEEEEAVQL